MGVIETVQISGLKTVIPVQSIKFIEQLDNCVEIVLYVKYSRKRILRGSLYIAESFESIKAKMEAAT